MAYEVRIYKTLTDYGQLNAVEVIDGITNKRDARREGRRWLSDHDVVKVQSDDREFIETLMSDAAKLDDAQTGATTR